MRDVFTINYANLHNILPAKQLSFHFVSKQIISFSEEEEIQQAAGQNQAASVILRNIQKSLKAEQTKSFDELLSIMIDYGGLNCKQLANQMKQELSQNVPDEEPPHQMSRELSVSSNATGTANTV